MSTHIPAPYLASELRAGKWTPNILQNETALRDRAADEMERLHAENETLHVENDTLRAGYDAARLEIASLRERVQELGQMARDVNSRRVTELEAQLEAVGAGGVEPLRKRCLHQISEPQAQPAAPAQAARAAQAEPEDLSVAYFMGLHAAKRAPQPAAQVAPVDAAVQQDAERWRTARSLEHCNAVWCAIGDGEAAGNLDATVDKIIAARAAQGGA